MGPSAATWALAVRAATRSPGQDAFRAGRRFPVPWPARKYMMSRGASDYHLYPDYKNSFAHEWSCHRIAHSDRPPAAGIRRCIMDSAIRLYGLLVCINNYFLAAPLLLHRFAIYAAIILIKFLRDIYRFIFAIRPYRYCRTKS